MVVEMMLCIINNKCTKVININYSNKVSYECHLVWPILLGALYEYICIHLHNSFPYHVSFCSMFYIPGFGVCSVNMPNNKLNK